MKAIQLIKISGKLPLKPIAYFFSHVDFFVRYGFLVPSWRSSLKSGWIYRVDLGIIQKYFVRETVEAVEWSFFLMVEGVKPQNKAYEIILGWLVGWLLSIRDTHSRWNQLVLWPISKVIWKMRCMHFFILRSLQVSKFNLTLVASWKLFLPCVNFEKKVLSAGLLIIVDSPWHNISDSN